MTFIRMRWALFSWFVFSYSLSINAYGELTGLWTFSDANNLGLATFGTDLSLTGAANSVSGIVGGDGAAQIGDNSYYTVTHGIGPNGGGSFVNQYTMLMDIQYPAASSGQWLSLYQTNTGNANDGDLFIRNSDQAIGLAALGGYSANTTESDTWYRVVLTVNNGVDRSVYVNGTQWLDGNAGSVDDRHSLDPFFLLFADENGDEDPVQISNLAIWDESLDRATVAGLGGPNPNGVTVAHTGPLNAGG